MGNLQGGGGGQGLGPQPAGKDQDEESLGEDEKMDNIRMTYDLFI